LRFAPVRDDDAAAASALRLLRSNHREKHHDIAAFRVAAPDAPSHVAPLDPHHGRRLARRGRELASAGTSRARRGQDAAAPALPATRDKLQAGRVFDVVEATVPGRIIFIAGQMGLDSSGNVVGPPAAASSTS